MNYNNDLKFITDCLTLSSCSDGIESLRDRIMSKQINWERVVEVSTSHLVLPAVYVNLKQFKLIKLLPDDLQCYMEHITSLNRARNLQNIEQLKELNELFLAYDIHVVFLKGTAHLLEGLYMDIAERMIGDIDLLVAPEKMEEAAGLLVKNGYVAMTTYLPEDFVRTKHYPRMIHKDKVFAVEIHKDVIQKISDRQLNYERINSAKRSINGYYLPSYTDLILHNIMNTQLNDNGFVLFSINLRQKYDLLLLSKFKKPIEAIEDFKFHNYKLKSYLVKTIILFKGVETLSYPHTLWSYWVMILMRLKFKYPKIIKIVAAFNFIIFRIIRDVTLVFTFLPDKNRRNRVLKYLTDPEHRTRYFKNIYHSLRAL